MLRALAFLIIGLAFGGGIGFSLGTGQGPQAHGAATTSGAELTEADHAAHAHDHSAMQSVASGPTAPTLQLRVLKDPDTGWNLHILTENFTFTAENAGQAHVDGQGHAHLYVNGEKRARVYGNWVHLAQLPRGEVEVSVSLNTNDHQALAVDHVPLVDTVLIENR